MVKREEKERRRGISSESSDVVNKVEDMFYPSKK